jgi:hypothetical protein
MHGLHEPNETESEMLFKEASEGFKFSFREWVDKQLRRFFSI